MKLHTLLFGVALAAVTFTPMSAGELPGSVSETVLAIGKKLERQGFEIEVVIDHGAAAASVDLDLPPTQVIFFSDTSTDMSLIRRGQTVALDLPLRFLVWEDNSGYVRIDTNDVGFLLDRHELATVDLRLLILGKVLGQFGSSDNGIRTVESIQSFDDTVAALRKTLDERGFRIPLVVEYPQRKHRGRSPRHPTTVVLFGNPMVGTPLMQNSRTIGLDLPQKMLIYEDQEGRILLSYNDPFFLASKHDVIGEDGRLRNIASALRNIAETAAGLAP